jgi:hypothetical protein
MAVAFLYKRQVRRYLHICWQKAVDTSAEERFIIKCHSADFSDTNFEIASNPLISLPILPKASSDCLNQPPLLGRKSDPQHLPPGCIRKPA